MCLYQAVEFMLYHSQATKTWNRFHLQYLQEPSDPQMLYLLPHSGDIYKSK